MGAPVAPALILDDGTAITESVAIGRYLESLYPEPNLYGRDAREIARIEMWPRRVEMQLATPLMLAVRHGHPGLSALEPDQCPEVAARNKDWGLRAMRMLDRRLKAFGSHYGALPAHAGLWEAADGTRDDALARLAVVPMVLEARGLDVTPATAERFAAAGDEATARILDRIYADEIRHVSVGARWFGWRCAESDIDPGPCWQALVRRHFRGALKPPFNDSARERAGLTRDWYLPLAAG